MENRAESLQTVWQAIGAGQRFFVAGHLNPDGDSIGCTLAMASLLTRMGKTVYAYAAPCVGQDLKFLPGFAQLHIGELPSKIDFDTVLLLECSDRKRGGNLETILQPAHSLINIDHHAVSEAYGTVNHIDAGASSTAEIIFQLFEESKGRFVPTAQEATCLYTGVATDTGRFVHSNTTAEALRVAAALVALGADVNTVNQVIYFTKPYVELKLQGRALEKMKLHFHNQYSEIVLTAKDFSELQALPAQTQGIVSLPTMIPGVAVSALIKEEPDKVSVNLRSRGVVDVSQIAHLFGGGGHARASGFKVTGKSVRHVADELANVISDVLKKLA